MYCMLKVTTNNDLSQNFQFDAFIYFLDFFHLSYILIFFAQEELFVAAHRDLHAWQTSRLYHA